MYHMDTTGQNTLLSLICIRHKGKTLNWLYVSEASTKSASAFLVTQHFRYSSCVKALLSNPNREHREFTILR